MTHNPGEVYKILALLGVAKDDGRDDPGIAPGCALASTLSAGSTFLYSGKILCSADPDTCQCPQPHPEVMSIEVRPVTVPARW